MAVTLAAENAWAADAYCTAHPVTLTSDKVGLKISMKSDLYSAPLLPPPPYTWLSTSEVEFVRATRSAPLGAAAATPAGGWAGLYLSVSLPASAPLAVMAMPAKSSRAPSANQTLNGDPFLPDI